MLARLSELFKLAGQIELLSLLCWYLDCRIDEWEKHVRREHGGARRPKNAVQKPAAAAAPVYLVADDDAGSNDPLILEKSYSMHGSEI